MRTTLIAVLGFLSAALFITFGTGVNSTTSAQPPTGTAEVNPKILAFLKPEEIPPGDSELQRKLKERHNVAVKLLQERVNDYRRGASELGPVFEATRLTAEAKLDLADGAGARAPVLQQLLDVAKLIEAHLEQQLAKGFGSKAELERARYGRLTIEVELLRGRPRGNP